jgi:hypothetical protein
MRRLGRVNVFSADADPAQAARCLPDRLVVKMSTEAGQVLSTAESILGTHEAWMWAPTHDSHPCVLWATQTPVNRYWLAWHGWALTAEHAIRYPSSDEHGSTQILARFFRRYLGARGVLTVWPQAMPEVYRAVGEYPRELPVRGPHDWRAWADHPVVEAYRRYLVAEKSMQSRRFRDGSRLVPSTWAHRQQPRWWNAQPKPPEPVPSMFEEFLLLGEEVL